MPVNHKQTAIIVKHVMIYAPFIINNYNYSKKTSTDKHCKQIIEIIVRS